MKYRDFKSLRMIPPDETPCCSLDTKSQQVHYMHTMASLQSIGFFSFSSAPTMGKTQKKNSKGRLDRYYYLAKEKGYRARSSFKLIQINEKFGHFLEKSKVVVDLCAAPGSWCQVASNLCPMNSLIIGVDIVPMKPLPKCILFQSDITTEDCRSKLRGHLKTWKVDTFLHDGAPNVGLGWVQDAFTQSQLVLKALKLAAEHLIQGGTFITKVFRSKDYNNLIWVFQQLFDKVEATKPPASRNVSAEIFVVCKGFKAPKKLDNRLLDLSEVFEEIVKPQESSEAKVFNPEKKTRKREGYEEGNYLLYKEMDLLDFIRDEEPIKHLGELNRLTEPPLDNKEWKLLLKMKLWSPELRECVNDLKVLGKKEFKRILKFRKQARSVLLLDQKSEEEGTEEVSPLTEEEQISQELASLQEKLRQKRKREKKAANESKQKEIKRLQMNMLTDMSIGIDAADNSSQTLFNLNAARKTGQIEALANGKKRMVLSDKAQNTDVSFDDTESKPNSDSDISDLEDELELMYKQFKLRQAEKSSRLKSKLSRGHHEDENWEGIQSDSDSESESVSTIQDVDESDDEAIEDMAKNRDASLCTLTNEAHMFYSLNPILSKIDESVLLESLSSNSSGELKVLEGVSDSSEGHPTDDVMSDNFGIVADDLMDKRSDSHDSKVEIDTVEAMTLAHQVALGKKNLHDLIDEGINRYSFRDKDSLPDWFIEDEKKHSKITKPITKEAAATIREKQKQLNARPIKKVLEAQGRKKMRAVKRLEKLKKKSDLINEDTDKSEKDKADEIQRLMRKLSRKGATKPKATLVVAKGHNRGLSGRPKGVKGKYKMVDGVMKNEQRALKRISKKHRK